MREEIVRCDRCTKELTEDEAAKGDFPISVDDIAYRYSDLCDTCRRNGRKVAAEYIGRYAKRRAKLAGKDAAKSEGDETDGTT